jgi:integrase-like protein
VDLGIDCALSGERLPDGIQAADIAAGSGDRPCHTAGKPLGASSPIQARNHESSIVDSQKPNRCWPQTVIAASTLQLGGLPWSYPWVWRVFQNAAADAGIGKLGIHTMRHSYRSWLDAVGTPIAVRQKLMRHASITTTLNIYGDVVTDEMSQAHSRVVQLALSKQ